MKFHLKQLKATDAKSIKDIYDLVFPPSMNKDLHTAWRWRLDDLCLGSFTSQGDLVGFILCDVGGYRFESIYVNFIAVHPDFQQYGIGSTLIKSILQKAINERKSVSLTPVPVKYIQSWYSKHGFYITHIEKANEGGDFILMNFHSYLTRKQLPYLMKL